ncbi:MAG: Gfo/Idh/MocA family oxidoreductase [Candidatus Kapaibacterium sp.]
MHATNERPLRIGVVGVGHLGKIHARLWKEVEGAELIGVFDEVAESRDAIAKEYDVLAFEALEDILDSVDAISVVTPTFAHHAVAKVAIARGIHVLIEKPITTTLEEAEELLSLAITHNVKIQVGHVERFNPALLVVEPYLKNPRFFESHRLAQFTPRGTDVPVVLDLMVHDIDVILSLVKSPVVHIDASGIAVVSEQVDIANARIKFENGAIANVTSSRISQNPMRKLRIFERDAYLSIDFATKSAEVFRLLDEEAAKAVTTPMMRLGQIENAEKPRSIVYERPVVKDLNPLKHELELFLHAIRTDTEPIVSGIDGMRALKVANEIMVSIASQTI